MQKQHQLLTQFFDDSLSLDVDQKRKLYSFLAFSYFGIIVLFIFSYKNYLLQNNSIAFITLFCALAILANALLYHVKHCLQLCSILGSFFIVSFCLVLSYHGGVESTALYWIFPFPMILFAVLGHRIGAWFNGVMFFSLIGILMSPDFILAHYSYAEKIRFIASLSVVNVLSFINEHYRDHSYSAISALNTSNEQQANTDPLTHLPNRRFIDVVYLPASKVNVVHTFPLVVVMADVDHFKKFNDNYGHQTGDLILKCIANTMAESVRKEDVVARVGGEEFLILFPNTDYELGLKVAEKIRKKISGIDFEHANEVLQTTMSFGVSIAYNHNEITSKLKEADAKLYQAKHNGRNCVI